MAVDCILRGTTPEIVITLTDEDISVGDFTAIEYTIGNDGNVWTYSMDDLTIDAENNTITKKLTEKETLRLKASKSLIIQFRAWVGDDIVGIIKPIRYKVMPLQEEKHRYGCYE